MNPRGLRLYRCLAIGLIPFLLLLFYLIYRFDLSLYMLLTQEDNVVEWLTVACLYAAGIISAVIFVRLRRESSPYRWFFAAFSLACFLFGLEEMSWGQRLLGIESTDFFLKNSDQQEINVHNVLQKRYGFKTKHLAAQVLFYYGTVLPILVLDERIKRLVEKTRAVIPPVTLALGFFIAALLMWDKPTGREEELGELFFSICFVLFMVWAMMTSGNRSAEQGPVAHYPETTRRTRSSK